MPSIPFTVYGPAQGYFIPRRHDSRTLAYTAAHSGVLDVPRGRADAERALSRLFAEGNGHGDGPGFTVGGRSLTSGDVAHLEGLGVWLCAALGWTQLDGTDAVRFPLVHSAETEGKSRMRCGTSRRGRGVAESIRPVAKPQQGRRMKAQRSPTAEQADLISRLAEQHPERPAPPHEPRFCVETRIEVEGFVAGGVTRVPVGTRVGFPLGERVNVETRFPAGVEVMSIPLAALFPPATEDQGPQDEPSPYGAAIRAWAAGTPAPAAAREEIYDRVEWLRCFGESAEEHAAEHGCEAARKDAAEIAAELDALLAAESAFGYTAA